MNWGGIDVQAFSENAAAFSRFAFHPPIRIFDRDSNSICECSQTGRKEKGGYQTPRHIVAQAPVGGQACYKVETQSQSHGCVSSPAYFL
jgi:hypothetical protein